MINSKSQVLFHLIDFLSDENIGKFICYVYGIKTFDNPYSSYKELLFNILFNNIDNVIFKKVTSDELIESFISKLHIKQVIMDGLYNKQYNIFNIDDQEHLLKSKLYSKVDALCKKNKFQDGIDPISLSSDTQDKYWEERVNFYNGNQLPINDYSNIYNPFREFFLDVTDAIRSFNIQVKTRDKSRYKKYLNNIIKRIIEKREFYKFEEEYDGNKKVLLILDFSPIKDNIYKLKVKDVLILKNIKNCVYIKGEMEDYKIEGISTVEYKDKSTQSLIGSPDTTNFDKKLEEIDKAVNNYLNVKKTCKMCGRPYSKSHRCNDCQKLMDLILNENKEQFKNKKYNVKYAIQKTEFSESSYSNAQLRKIRYDNVKKLLQNVKISNKIVVEELVNKMFGDIEPFHF